LFFQFFHWISSYSFGFCLSINWITNRSSSFSLRKRTCSSCIILFRQSYVLLVGIRRTIFFHWMLSRLTLFIRRESIYFLIISKWLNVKCLELYLCTFIWLISVRLCVYSSTSSCLISKWQYIYYDLGIKFYSVFQLLRGEKLFRLISRNFWLVHPYSLTQGSDTYHRRYHWFCSAPLRWVSIFARIFQRVTVVFTLTTCSIALFDY
jgi:hypothetical protein